VPTGDAFREDAQQIVPYEVFVGDDSLFGAGEKSPLDRHSRCESADHIGTAGREVFDSLLDFFSLRRGES